LTSFCKSACAFLGLAALSLAVAPVRAQQAYAIGNGGDTLIGFNIGAPGTVSSVTFGGAATSLDAIDFRPATGQLYGYNDANDATYLVNPTTGALTLVGASPNGSPTNTFVLGMDFNPTIDRFRSVTESTQNIVINPNNGVANAPATNLFYAAGDPNAGIVPLVIENAYSNNIAGTGASTVQYVIDYDADIIATLANNAGTLNTIGSLGVDTDIYTGFDIFTDPMMGNSAYALLTPTGGTAGLYSINLGTGAATLLGGLGGGFSQVYSLAIAPTQVPEPGTVALLAGAALGAVPVLRRRRKR
jgi:hypothetical protein